MYGLCVWLVPERGKMPYAPSKRIPKLAILEYFFANGRPPGVVNSTSMKLIVWSTIIV